MQKAIRPLQKFWHRSVAEIPADVATSVMISLSEMSQPKTEPPKAILGSKTRAIFAYGTLRADFSAKGDKWGVVGPRCKWTRATVSGFQLYQEPNLYYPFAIETRNASHTIVGTLLRWPGDDKSFVDALLTCNRIEGWEPGKDPRDCLYTRRVVHARPVPNAGVDSKSAVSLVDAYMYLQRPDPEKLKSCVHYPNGDWLKPHGTTKLTKGFLTKHRDDLDGPASAAERNARGVGAGSMPPVVGGAASSDGKMAVAGPETGVIGSVRIIEGDLTNSSEQYIVHQCNCVTRGAKGLAKILFEKFPKSDCYRRRKGRPRGAIYNKPGTVSVASGERVVNLFGQVGPGRPRAGSRDDTREKRLGYFVSGLRSIFQFSNLKSIAFPFQIGCGLAGGSWSDYLAAIEAEAARNPSVRVVIYKLPAAAMARFKKGLKNKR